MPLLHGIAWLEVVAVKGWCHLTYGSADATKVRRVRGRKSLKEKDIGPGKRCIITAPETVFRMKGRGSDVDVKIWRWPSHLISAGQK